MAAAHFQVGSLIALVDVNGLQVDGPTENVLSLGPLARKWESFQWEVLTVNGHDLNVLCQAVSQCMDSESSFPKVILANTIKGKGVSFMENQVAWHCKNMTAEQFEQAVAEVKGEKDER